MDYTMNALVLGGTGFLGTSLRREYPTFTYWGTKTYRVETTPNTLILDYVKSNDITHVIDFTKNNHNHIVPAIRLINSLENVIYVHISTYGVMFDNMFLHEEEYYSTKSIIEKSIRKIDYSIRVPMILETQDYDKIFKGVRTEYMYTLEPNEFVVSLLDILSKPSGHYIMPSRILYK